MSSARRAGILLHPTSLPGPFGIGDLGPQAFRWIDFLEQADLSIWQVLPLRPAGFGDSPYQSHSDFAGNPNLISPEGMVEDGLLAADDIQDPPSFPADRADYPEAFEFKARLMHQAYERFLSGALPGLREEYRVFCEVEKDWLEDYSLYAACKRAKGGLPWWKWEGGLADFHSQAAAQARQELVPDIQERSFEQFLFCRQWERLRAYARKKGVQILGDLPIFPAHDSADVWVNRRYFLLDENGMPKVVAGVPPDYFSPTGQLWGNPIFDWDALRSEQYAGWVKRVRAALRWFNKIRLDHFRGYVQYWAVPAGHTTAETGSWTPGPGEDLFRNLREALGGLPFVAEDLGIITPDVTALREKFGLPGMRVLQFAFGGGAENPFLPHNFDPHTAVYTGTHDNDTTRGWFLSLGEEERGRVRRYLGRDGSDIAWDFIRLAWSSVAETAIAPLQDVLSLGSEARMNTPGTSSGNWAWRFRAEDLGHEQAERLREITELFGRMPVR
jgi:4-alpha-glucanotransferase